MRGQVESVQDGGGATLQGSSPRRGWGNFTPTRLFSRRWIPATILVIVGMMITARLGIWQLDRLEQRRAFNQRVWLPQNGASNSLLCCLLFQSDCRALSNHCAKGGLPHGRFGSLKPCVLLSSILADN